MSYNPCKSDGREALLRESPPGGAPENPPVEQEHAPRPQQSAPRAVTAHERAALLRGDTAVKRGAEWLRPWGHRATERGLHEPCAQEQAAGWGRRREEPGPLKPAEGVLRVPGPPGRGRATPSHAPVGAKRAPPRARLKPLRVERWGGGRAPRAREAAGATARGPGGRSPRALRPLPATLRQAYEAWRPRDLGGYDVAALLLAPVDAPGRRGDRTTGGRWGWGRGGAGRQRCRPLSTATSASGARGRAVRRALPRRGLQRPGPSTTAGAPGRIKAGRGGEPDGARRVPEAAEPGGGRCARRWGPIDGWPRRVRTGHGAYAPCWRRRTRPCQQPVGGGPTRPRPASRPSRGPPGRDRLGAPRRWRRGRVRRHAAGPPCCRIGGMPPAS